MSSSNITDDSLNAINTISIMFTRYWCIIMFILGLIGHSLNISVFTRPTLWSNPCIRYLMASAIFGYLIIFLNLPIRLLQYGYNINLFISSVVLCKTLPYLFSWIRILPCWFIASASVDRYLCSSTSKAFRDWSSIHVSKYVISLTIVLIGLTQIPILIYYEINPQPKLCLAQASLFLKLNGILLMIVWSLIPSITMLIFGLLTIRHIRQSTRRIADQNNINARRRRAKFIDRELIRIVLIQSILFGLTSATGAMGAVFNPINDNTHNDPIILAKLLLLVNVLSFIGLFSPCISFYLCTLSSQLFRRELAILFHFRKRQDQIHPIENIILQRRK